ncbi:MAG: hypothetical protein KAJ75_09560 [Alphaproteobacteria bacterium]|nr:hypothetical protein [Alphaproteobacteria bacterium]
MTNKTKHIKLTQKRFLNAVVLCLFIVGLTLNLTACGRKNAPQQPKGSSYPEFYPKG